VSQAVGDLDIAVIFVACQMEVRHGGQSDKHAVFGKFSYFSQILRVVERIKRFDPLGQVAMVLPEQCFRERHT